jgi:Zn-dependent protease with chaperone function
MTNEQFDALVYRLEVRYASRPGALAIRTAAWLLIGYAGFLGWLLAVLILSGLFLFGAVAVDSAAGLLLLALGAVLLTVGGVQVLLFLWVTLPAAQGRRLTRNEFPALFDRIDRVRRSSGAARIHDVVSTIEFNAGVAEAPRLGVFGWPRRSLLLGLPLLECLSLPEFESVLAHEFAHLSARHGRFTSWIYRLRRTWEMVFQTLQSPPKSSTERTLRRALGWFLNWYWPRFNAHAFVLSRANEYQADRCAAESCGPATAAAVLWTLDCNGARLSDKFWPDLWLSANNQPDPPADVLDRLLSHLAATPEPADAARWMEQAAQRLTDNAHTHPSFSDRVQALGLEPESFLNRGFPPPARPSAAESLFREALPTLRRDVVAHWRQAIADAWRGRYCRAATLQRQLATLDQATETDQQSVDRLWDRVCTLINLEGARAAEPLLRQLLALRPGHSEANYVLGSHLLEQGAADGEQHLLAILESDDDHLIPQTCQVLAGHFQSQGRSDRLREIRQRLSRFEEESAAAQRERSMVTASDHFSPHDLTDAALAALRDVLARHDRLHAAFLVRKELRHFPRQRLFVLCVRTKPNFFGRSNADTDATLTARLIPEITLPGRVLVIAPQGGFRKLGRKVMGFPESQVYPRS